MNVKKFSSTWLTKIMRPIFSAYSFLLCLILAGGGSSCLQERDRSAEVEALIQETIEERLANYERIRRERCREEILDEANRITDSLLIEEARSQKDTLDRPPRPARPQKPEIRQLEDTTPVKPLLPDTLEQDTGFTSG